MTDTPSETDSQITQVDADWRAPTAGSLPLHTKDVHFIDPKFEVVLEPKDDPMQLAPFRKWSILLTICSAALCVATASSAVRFSAPSRMPCANFW